MSVRRSKIVWPCLCHSLSRSLGLDLFCPAPFSRLVDSQFGCCCCFFPATPQFEVAHRFSTTTLHFIRFPLCLFTSNFSFVDFRRHRAHFCFSCRHLAISIPMYEQLALHMFHIHTYAIHKYISFV